MAAMVDFVLGQISIGQRHFNLNKQDADQCSRFEVANTVTIPPRSEIMITGWLKRRKGRICIIYGFGAVENIPSVNRSTGVLVAKSLMCTRSAEIPLSVLNLGQEPVTLHKGRMVALLQPVQSVVEINVEDQEVSGTEGGDGKEVLNISVRCMRRHVSTWIGVKVRKLKTLS